MWESDQYYCSGESSTFSTWKNIWIRSSLEVMDIKSISIAVIAAIDSTTTTALGTTTGS